MQLQDDYIENSEDGNTLKSSQSRKWVFTLNNYSNEEHDYITTKVLEMKNLTYIIGKEVGESGTPHLQGYLHFKTPRKFETLKRLNNRLHLEIARGTDEQNYVYCSKENDFVTNIKKPYTYKLTSLYKWQENLLSLVEIEVKNPNDRVIHWYIDPEGGKGKTSMCKHLYHNYPGTLYLTGKATDMKYAIFQHLEQKKPLNLVVMDFTRTSEGYVSYQGIEEIKNGIFFNGKYESGCVSFEPPIVICFSNWAPDKEALSKDRWNIQLL